MRKLPSFISRNIFPILLFGIICAVLAVNYTPGTFLTGWDTLHPEFNPLLNLKRIFFGVWRQEQGLGALAGHSHMSELPRIIFLYLSSLVLPLSFLRYFYFFLTLLLGPLGVYFFLAQVVFRDKPELSKKMAAFLGGLFYFLNLGTLQHFYVPFEMFATQYAALPWLFLFATKFLIEGQRKTLILFCLVTFLAAPMAYAATLWYVYFASLSIFVAFFFLINSRIFTTFRRAISIVLLTLTVNAFWLLPNFYLILTSGTSVSQAKINQVFSQKAFAHDLKYATLGNAALLKGFLFDWQEYNKGFFIYLLDEWHKHLGNPLVSAAGWVLFGVVAVGILITFLKREKLGLAIFPVFLFAFFFLTYAHSPLNVVCSFLRDHFGLFQEGLRFPWTKFSILAMFCFSFYFAQAILGVLTWLKGKIYHVLILVILSALIIFWMWPVFSGHLISPTRRTKIPNDYFEVFSWFKSQPQEARLAVFPTPTIWGWDYYDWGFEGAGFLWFGLEQPVLVRDFDRWSPANENFYWEASYAFYSQNQKLLESVLEKYQVSYLVVDGHLINPSWPKALYSEELAELLDGSQKVTLAQTLGKIRIYHVNLETSNKDSVQLAQNLPVVEPTYQWDNQDLAYLENGDYISPDENSKFPTSPRLRGASKTKNSTYYPFRSFFSGKNQEDLEFTVEDKGDYFLFQKKITEQFRDWPLLLPEFDRRELLWINPDDLSQIRYLEPEVHYSEGRLEVRVPKVGGYLSAEFEPVNEPSAKKAQNCDRFNRGEVTNEEVLGESKKFLRLSATGANNCSAAFWFPNLSHSLSYLITVESRNISGSSFLFWVENLNIHKADIESYLPKTLNWQKSYFIQPPMEKDGLGYGVHFDDLSIGREPSVNDLGEVMINLIPYKFLTGIKLAQSPAEILAPETIALQKISHPNPSLYQIELPPFDTEATLVLYQSSNDGWKAYGIESKAKSQKSKLVMFLAPFFGRPLKDRILVNNWANGWVVEPGEGETVVLVFWPQYLEYLGFTVLAITSIWLLRRWR